MHINDLINPDLMHRMISGGFIKGTSHPNLPLVIYNYTEKAQFSRLWNTATLQCRGLIVNQDTGQIVARPFPKFFNWDEQKPKGREHQMDLDEPVTVTDKLDGSLGILYPAGHGAHLIATRGSFTSDQAKHASGIWFIKYDPEFGYRLNPRLTYLFEIIYPGNRIVVDYKDLDDLVLIGAVDIEAGFIYGPESIPGWPGPRASVYPYQTLREAVHARPRQGQEGFVVRSLSTNLMVKTKQEDYVSLHKIVTGLNEKEIWRRSMKADLELPPEVKRDTQILKDIPDELHDWAHGVADKLFREVYSKSSQVWDVYQRIVGIDRPFKHFVDREDRKLFALTIRDKEPWMQKALWILYDGNDPREFLWKTIEPRGDVKK